MGFPRPNVPYRPLLPSYPDSSHTAWKPGCELWPFLFLSFFKVLQMVFNFFSKLVYLFGQLRFRVVPQEITIFNGTVLDNILLGEQGDPEEIVNFCRKFGFEKFIAQLPQGYGTIVGEEGINLSGGQKQIIGLIRAGSFPVVVFS